MEVDGAENDLYVAQAQDLLAGRPFLDTFHPAHYPLAVAAGSWVLGGDVFLAARLVSACASGLLVAATMALAMRLGGRLAAWTAGIAVLTRGVVVVHGVIASSDMLGTALVVLAAAAGARAQATGRLRDALATGACFGLAWGTRNSNVAFVPVLLLPVLTRGMDWRGCARAATALGLGCVLGYLPHGILNMRQFGSPFANDNWKNIALKLSHFDGALFTRMPYASLRELLAARGGDVWRAGLADLADECDGGLGRLFAPGASSTVAVAVGGALLLALAWQVRRQSRLAAPLAGAFLAQLGVVCFTFVPTERALLPLLPLGLGLLAAPLSQRPRWLAVPFAVAMAAATGFGARDLWYQWRHFLARHPVQEVAVLREVAAQPDVERVAATYSSAGRHIAPVAYVGIWEPPAGTVRTSEQAFAFLRQVQRGCAVDDFVIGRLTRERLHRLLRYAEPPAGIECRQADDEVIVLHFQAKLPSPWIASSSVMPVHWREGPLDLCIAVAAERPAERVVGAGYEATLADGRELRVPLAKAEGPCWRLRLVAAAQALVPAGDVALRPFLCLDDGGREYGRVFVLPVERPDAAVARTDTR